MMEAFYRICLPPLPGYDYKISDDPRQSLCGMSIMMPWMLYSVQVMFSLIVWATVAPNLSGLRWLVSAPGSEHQWDAIEIVDRQDDPDGDPPTTVGCKHCWFAFENDTVLRANPYEYMRFYKIIHYHTRSYIPDDSPQFELKK